ncbi:MAG: hypothetical protein DMG13_19105 [Acidobacteria bacterium]|nr:MAG: hypothetical protein DMG13_19105 [Acidobacteriota bacterium]
MVVVALFSALPVFSNTIIVTNTSDTGPGSLRDAIASASAGDSINFAVTGTITLSATLVLDKNVTITGPGASILAISGNNSVRVFVIYDGVTATISGITIKSGSDRYGAGVTNSGTLTLTNCTISDNHASIWGGGIYNIFGTLTLANSTVSGNSSSLYYGGGIFNQQATLMVTNSSISGNSTSSTEGGGGGIANYLATLTVANSTVSGNSALSGGGLYSYGGPLVVTNSTVAGNFATWAGGGTLSLTALTMINDTLSGNSALYGGGVFNDNKGMLTVKNTILAISTGGNCYLASAVPTSGGHNLSDDNTCTSFLTATGDLNGTPPGLDPAGLQNNGGSTQTIALLSTSPAVDAIPISPTNYCMLTDGITPVATDQRGVTRPQGPACDIGAFELQPPPLVIHITSPVNATYLINQLVASNYSCSDSVALVSSCAGPVASGADFDTASLGTKNFTVNATDSAGNKASVTVPYRVIYKVCLLYDPTKAVNSGNTIPIKLYLCDATNADVSSLTMVVHAVGIQQLSGAITGPVQDSGNANPDNDFRYDPTLGPTGGYIFNFSTKGLPTGTYELQFTASGDPALYAVSFQVK